jgi:hypothetical protein
VEPGQGEQLVPQAPSLLGHTHWLPEQILLLEQSGLLTHPTHDPDRHFGVNVSHLLPQVRQLFGSEPRSEQLLPHSV